jgi:UDP-glucose 4-epimerase
LINTIATRNLANAAKEEGIERFVFISSVRAQIGPSARSVVREADDAQPTNDYGRTKLAAEDAVRASGVPFTILRPVAVYGPHPKGNVKSLLRLAMMPLPLPIQGIASRRSLLGVDNLIAAILFLLSNPATVRETYLVADSTAFSVSELVAMMRKARGRRSGLIYIPAALLHLLLILLNRGRLWPRISENLIVDTGKLQALGWRPTVDTYDGIVAMMLAETGATTS